MHFGEYELFPSLIGLSPLPTGHPKTFQRQLVRSSTVIYYDGDIIGQTSSCAFGYRIGKPVALGKVHDRMSSGAAVKVDIARQLFDATLFTCPLFDAKAQRMKS